MINENSRNCVAMIDTLLKEEYTKAPRVFVKNVRINIVEKGKLIYDELKQTCYPEHRFLFDRQSIAGRTGLLGEPSSGLGLSICKRLAELMNARVGFESEEGMGARFYILFPKTPISSQVFYSISKRLASEKRKVLEISSQAGGWMCIK